MVVEFILNHVDVLFSAKLSTLIREGGGTYTHEDTDTHSCKLAKTLAPYCCFYRCFPFTGHNSLSRPKSLLISSPSTKLLSLEEAQARTQAQINSPVTEDSKYIEVGEGPAALQGKFHTVIEFPTERFVISTSRTDHRIYLKHDTLTLTCHTAFVLLVSSMTVPLTKGVKLEAHKQRFYGLRGDFEKIGGGVIFFPQLDKLPFQMCPHVVAIAPVCANKRKSSS